MQIVAFDSELPCLNFDGSVSSDDTSERMGIDTIPQPEKKKPEMPDSSVGKGTDRENMFELFAERDKENWLPPTHDVQFKPLGIGYGPISGQQFPEACAYEMILGPQGESLEVRYDPDQPRDSSGKWTSGGGVLFAAPEKTKELTAQTP
jgi:hypothetical protein